MSKLIEYVPEILYDNSTHRYVNRVIGEELANLSGSCYYPKLIQYLKDLKFKLGVTDEMITNFKKRNFSKKIASFQIMTDEQAVLLMMCVVYFTRINKRDVALLFYKFLALKFHYNLMHRQFKFCIPDFFSLAMEEVSHRHLYKTHGGIPGTIVYLSNAEFKKYEKAIVNPRFNDDVLQKMIYALRTRLSQSLKSFAETYYSLAEERTGIGASDEDTTDQSGRVIDKISSTMCAYGHIDTGSLSYATTKSGIRKNIAHLLISEISNPEHTNQIKFILNMINKVFGLKSLCQESHRLKIIRKIENGQKINNYSIRDSILELIKATPSSHNTSSIYESQLVIFFSHYLTMFVKRRIC